MNAPHDSSQAAGAGHAPTMKTLPAQWYFDPAQYARELERIWYRNWLYVCRSDALATPRDFRVFTVGTQNILLVRDEEGALHAFHNTCRHRGARLCADESGCLSTPRIVCPYHRWSYTLQGQFVGAPFVGAAERICEENLSLYTILVREWRGFVFINLSETPGGDLDSIMDPHAQELCNWPLEELRVGHTHRTVLHCNWKIFWENFLECYHCPGVHPALCRLVPVYRRAISTAEEARSLPEYCGSHDPHATDGLCDSAETWSMDGKVHGARFANLTAEEAAQGYRFLMAWPTMYMVAHPDYVRIVSFRPLAPESLQLTVEWLFPAETLAMPNYPLANVTEFAKQVIAEDGEVSELNQAGLHSIRHHHGFLVPQEADIARFHSWVMLQLEAV